MADLLNFYGLTQPGYDEWDILEPLTEDNIEMPDLMDDAILLPPSTRPPPGSPAPRPVPVGDGAPVRSALEVAASGHALRPYTTRYLSPDVWRYRVLPFCDIATLLRLNQTCHQIRATLNDPHFVVEWQEQAWFLRQRGCFCERNQFYLDVGQFLDFGWDCVGIESSRQSEIALKSMGRCTNLELAPTARLSRVDPREATECFGPGLLDIWYENWLVPMPRMVYVPVENALPVGPVPSAFWRHCHAVPEEEARADDETEETDWLEVPIQARPGADRDTYFFSVEDSDLVDQYFEDCKRTGRDPHDPAQDNLDCLGYRANRWARRRLYETAVGIQTYPLVHCIRRSELLGRAQRDGVDYMDNLFLPAQRSFWGRGDNECVMMQHRGPIYFHPVRYNNEKDDFVPWALSTLCVLQAVHQNAWFDSIHYIIQRVDDFARQTANDLEAVFPFHRLAERWDYLHRVCWLGETAHPRASRTRYTTPAEALDAHAERKKDQDQKALDLLYDPQYITQNRWMNHKLDLWKRGSVLAASYMTDLLPDNHRHYAAQRNEATLVHELRQLLHVTDYIVKFVNYVGPLTDRVSEMCRTRNLSIYLGVGTSLLMFSPAFQRTPSWEPNAPVTSVGSRIPRINLQHNHRFRKYLRFLNRRTLFYATEPLLPADQWRQEA